MSKPVLDRSQHADEAFYAFMGRVRLRLVEHNVDAITATMFLRALLLDSGVVCSRVVREVQRIFKAIET